MHCLTSIKSSSASATKVPTQSTRVKAKLSNASNSTGGSNMRMGTELVAELRYLKLNISGKHFRCLRQDFIRYLDTRLGKLAAACNWQDASVYCETFIEDTQEYYFSRSQYLFDSILDFYRYEELHLPNNGCPDRFIAELEFWQIDKKYIALCCQQQMPQRLMLPSNCVVNLELPDNLNIANHSLPRKSVASNFELDLAQFDDKRCGFVRKHMWNFLENPASSRPAMAFNMFSMGFILATAIILVLDSMPEFQYTNPETNITDVIPALTIADGVCVGWFSMEYLLRLLCAPSTCAFIRQPISLIDIFAIVPFYIETILGTTTININVRFFRSLLLLRLLRLLRMLRVLRILKVARYSSGFRAVGRALYRSWRELILLVMFIITTCLLFSTLMYFFERDEPGTKIVTIPHAAWWCIITMTTVGYGDVYPVSIAGKFLAGFVCISGVVILAFPISIIVENFNIEYVEKKAEKEHSGISETMSPCSSNPGSRRASGMASIKSLSNNCARCSIINADATEQIPSSAGPCSSHPLFGGRKRRRRGKFF